MSRAPATPAVVVRFEEAAKARAFIGMTHPGDHGAIEREYSEALAAIVRAVKRRPKA